MVEEVLDETLYWLEIIVESGLLKANLLDDLIKENQELFRIIVSSISTMKKRSIRRRIILKTNCK
jgi:four helix bundle protein